MKLVPKYSVKPVREVVHGKDVSIGITMSPIASPCAPARVIDADGALVTELGCGDEYQLEPCAGGTCAPDALGWLIQPTPGTEYIELVGGVDRTRHAWVLPDVSPSLDGDEANGHPIILRLGSLPIWGSNDGEAPTVDQSWLFYGVPFGDAAGIRWEWVIGDQSPVTLPTERPEPPTDSAWWEGVEVEQVGQFVQVRILPGYVQGYMFGGDWRANIYATAFCGDTEIGTLEIEILVGY